MGKNLDYMSDSQAAAYLAATIRLKRIEHGADPETGERRSDWRACPEMERIANMPIVELKKP